jgi:hypothetical protein
MEQATSTLARALAALLAAAACGGLAAAEPDWSKVPGKKFTIFYPGVTPVEWILKGTEHGGARGIRKGEACTGCHEEETADLGKRIVGGSKLEPAPLANKAPAIPVTVQAAHDGTQLYLRFSWTQPPASGGSKLDADHQVKLGYMLEANKVEGLPEAGCWATCHADLRTMPGAKDDKKTKYVSGGALPAKFFDLAYWRSGKGGSFGDGHVADRRVMEGGKALVSATGKQAGDAWTVTFVRKLAGGDGDGDLALVSGKTYNFGFAIHDDWSSGRYHHVSLGYSLGIDAKADVTAAKQ